MPYHVMKTIQSKGRPPQDWYLQWDLFGEDRILMIDFKDFDGRSIGSVGALPCSCEVVSAGLFGLRRACYVQGEMHGSVSFQWAAAQAPWLVRDYFHGLPIGGRECPVETYGTQDELRRRALRALEQYLGNNGPEVYAFSYTRPAAVNRGYSALLIPRDCWYAVVAGHPRGEIRLCSSRLVCVSRAGGQILWDGSLHDEG